MRQTRRRSAELRVKMGSAYLWQASLELAWNFCMLLAFSRMLLGDLQTPSERLLLGFLLLVLCPLSIGNLILKWRQRRMPEPFALGSRSFIHGNPKTGREGQIQRLSIYLLPQIPGLGCRRFLDPPS